MICNQGQGGGIGNLGLKWTLFTINIVPLRLVPRGEGKFNRLVTGVCHLTSEITP